MIDTYRVGLACACMFCSIAMTVEAGDKRTLWDTAVPRPQVSGGHAQSDIPMRILRPQGTGRSSIEGTLAAIRRFHVTRLEWTYLDEDGDPVAHAELISKVQGMGVEFGGAKSRTSYVGEIPFEEWNVRDLSGQLLLTRHGNTWGCLSHPEYRAGQLRYVKALVDAGIDTLHRDDPNQQGRALRDGGGCFCDYCMTGFNRWLETYADADTLAQLGLADPADFDYRIYLKKRNAPVGAEFHEWPGDILKDYFLEFQRDTEVRFHQWWMNELNRYAGREISTSCNNVFDRFDHLSLLFDFWIGELHYSKATPDYLYRNIQRVHEAGRTQATTMPLYYTDTVSEGWIRHIRQTMATLYAVGGNMQMPWDTYIRGNPRFFGRPEDIADLSGFVHAMASNLDGYADAAAFGEGIHDKRWPERDVPVQVDSAKGSVYAFTRVTADKTAPVAIHLVDWSETPEPFQVEIDPRRFFGESPVIIVLAVPASYNPAAHQRAQEWGDYSELVVYEVLLEGIVDRINVPALNPWGILLVQRADE